MSETAAVIVQLFGNAAEGDPPLASMIASPWTWEHLASRSNMSQRDQTRSRTRRDRCRRQWPLHSRQTRLGDTGLLFQERKNDFFQDTSCWLQEDIGQHVVGVEPLQVLLDAFVRPPVDVPRQEVELCAAVPLEPGLGPERKDSDKGSDSHSNHRRMDNRGCKRTSSI